MKILVVGAGAVGGYFGGRLLQAGRDVTFLVRAGRAAALAQRGLRIRSRLGDAHFPNPPTVTETEPARPFDLILLSCKAYDLEGAMEAISPMVGPDTAILPLLNGMRHLESLGDRFGPEHILGGLCVISAALNEEGDILHLNEHHNLTYGELDGSRSHRVEAIENAFSHAGFDARLSGEIRQDMWEKWIFIASIAGITCLMRASVGDVVAAGAGALAIGLLDECAAIAAREGHPPRSAFLAGARSTITTPGSMLTASMLRDIEAEAAVECEQILGDLARRACASESLSLLRVAHLHVKAYEARRDRSHKITL
jgi:2-dehydropantoate 2-reductase